MASNTYEMTGVVKQISDPQTFPSGFTKREFVLTTQEDYPQQVKLECIKERCSLLDGVKPGDCLAVSFNVRGNEHNGRFFVNLQAWRIKPVAGKDGDAGGKADDSSHDNLEPLEEAEGGASGVPF